MYSMEARSEFLSLAFRHLYEIGLDLWTLFSQNASLIEPGTTQRHISLSGTQQLRLTMGDCFISKFGARIALGVAAGLAERGGQDETVSACLLSLLCPPPKVAYETKLHSDRWMNFLGPSLQESGWPLGMGQPVLFWRRAVQLNRRDVAFAVSHRFVTCVIPEG